MFCFNSPLIHFLKIICIKNAGHNSCIALVSSTFMSKPLWMFLSLEVDAGNIYYTTTFFQIITSSPRTTNSWTQVMLLIPTFGGVSLTKLTIKQTESSSACRNKTGGCSAYIGQLNYPIWTKWYTSYTQPVWTLNLCLYTHCVFHVLLQWYTQTSKLKFCLIQYIW